MGSGRATLAILLAACAACGSKTGILAVGEEMDAAVLEDGAPPDVFETFPCRWSYGQPLLLAPGEGGTRWAGLDGAVHGRLDTVWVHAEDTSAGDGRTFARLALGDPPRPLDPMPAALSQPQLHGLPDGWTALAPDCSLAFFDDDGRARRLVLPPRMPPPCFLSKLDPDYIDITYASAGNTTARLDSDGSPVFEVTADLVGLAGPTVVSTDGRYAAAFAATPASGVVRAVLIDVERRAAASDFVSLGTSFPGISTGLDRLRDAALVVLASTAGATLLRIPFDPSRFVPETFATTEPVADPQHSLTTNETEALIPLIDGTIAIQPLSGSTMRFLEPPAPAIQTLRIILSPGESRGGVLYTHGPDGRAALSFRTLVCNR